MISASALTKYYGDRAAIRDLDFEIEKGEIIGFLGLNGAGKTTTLKILACLLLPSRGTVKVNGLDVTEHPHEVRKLVGFLPESPPLYLEMTVEDFLLFAGQLRGLTRDQARRRLREVLELTDLVDVREQVIGTLSHGYRQRVGIAQAVIHDPPVLILDEPIKGLDPVQIVEIREMIRGLRGKHTILLSSHILPEISQTCDRLLMIKAGEIVAQGTEDELTQSLTQGIRLQVLVRGDAKKARDLVAGLEGVRECAEQQESAVHRALPHPAGTTFLRVVALDDVRERVAKALIDGGFGLLQLTPSEQELEQAFVKLSGGRRGDVAKAEAQKEPPASDDGPASEVESKDEPASEDGPKAAEEDGR